jgi:flagellar biosynthesis GTPase FlhF
MSTSEATDLNPTTESSIDLDLNSDASTTESLIEAVNVLSEQVSDLQATVQEQAETIDTLRSELDEEREQRGQEDAQVRARVHDVESRVEQVREHGSEDVEGGVQAEQTTMQDDDAEPQTDIEQMSRMPEPVLSEQTANVRRAVFVARDVSSYTTSCPAGRVITSGELRRVLQAGTDCAGHTQTVARVIDLLDRTGGDGTTVVERRGERRLVFEQDLVDRLSAQTQRCDSQRGQAV